MNKNSILKALLIIFILIFMIMSFFGGIRKVSVSDIRVGEAMENVRFIERDYASLFVVAISLIEIMLIAFSKGITACVGSILLNICKLVLPVPLLNRIEAMFCKIGDPFTYYELSGFGYVLIGLGVLIIVLYLLNICNRIKHRSNS